VRMRISPDRESVSQRFVVTAVPPPVCSNARRVHRQLEARSSWSQGGAEDAQRHLIGPVSEEVSQQPG
jgi:hypothetical protein